MVTLKKTAPQLAVVLAALIMWASFAWGLPAEAGEGNAAPTAEDVWAGVRISDAYDYAQCPSCGEKNELRAEKCSRCGYDLPQPSAEFTYPPWVFVPGEGYYREGTLLEPAKTNKALWITGLVVTALGVGYTVNRFSIASENPSSGHILEVVAGISVTALGVAFTIFGFEKTEPVYAFASGELYEPYDRAPYTLRSPDPEDFALKVEVTLLSF